MEDRLIVTIDDVRQAGHCVLGSRTWFEANGLPFRKFVRDGLPAADLLATGDALAVKVVTMAKARVAHG